MQSQFRQPGASSPRSARRGTSLIEILVVLVILVIGILSIVRLFPAGFIALRNAENNTFADRLAQAALEQLKKEGNGLPDAIYMYTVYGSQVGFDPNVAPGDLRTYNPDANGFNQNGGAVATAYDDINKQRYISNETITVPAPHMTVGSNGMSAAYPPLHVVNFGPIYLPDASVGTAMSHSDSLGMFLAVNSAPWVMQAGDSRLDASETGRSIDNPIDILQPGQAKYLADLNGGRLAVPPAAYLKNGSTTAYVNQDFVAVVTTTNTITNAVTTTAVALSIPNTYDGNWFDNTTGTGATNLTFGNTSLPSGPWTSVTLYRPFRYMGPYTAAMGATASTTFDTDPYEFALDATNVGTNINMGVIAFNPVAAGQSGSQPLKARLSYMTQDWHILHEDQTVEAGASTVRLTLNHLKKIGDVQFDQSVYNGLLPGGAAADILVLDLDTGAITNLAAPAAGASGGNTFNADDSTGNDPSSTPTVTQYAVSYQNGRVTFPSSTAAQHVRFFYAGDADWALAIQKAASAYTIVNAGAGGVITAPASADYAKLTAVGPEPNNCVIDFANQRAYFPLCDAGKTVEFDGISYGDSNNRTQQIGEGTAAISTDQTTIGGQTVVSVNLGGTGLNSSGILPSTPSTTGTTPPTIQAVRGISVQATVIWHEHNNWRTRTIDTLLTQTQ